MGKGIKKAIIVIAVLAGGFIAAIVAYNSLSGRVAPGGGTFADAISVYDGDGQKSDVSSGKNTSDKAAADFSVIDDNGNNTHLSDHFGKPIVLNFWTTWCPPCRAEMPALDAAFGDNGDIVEYMAVNLTDGYRDTKDSVQEYVKESGYGFPVYYDTAGSAAKAYSIMTIPTTVFIKKDGTVLATHRGALTKESLKEYVNELMK